VEAKQRVFAYRAKGSAATIDEALAIAKMHASEIIDWEKSAGREKFVHEWVTAAYSPRRRLWHVFSFNCSSAVMAGFSGLGGTSSTAG
jgi:hypothetical protein